MKKIRILEILVIIITIKLTPIAINYANSIRHYKGYGGEYLIPIFGVLVIFALETYCEFKDIVKNI